MKVAITGGTGFVGAHMATRLLNDGHRVVLVSRSAGGRPDRLDREGSTFAAASVGDADALAEAFKGCNAVVHLAGINHERGEQTYRTVHVEGTRNVVTAACDCHGRPQ